MGGISKSSTETVPGADAALHIDISETRLILALEKEARRTRKTPAQLAKKIIADFLEEAADARAVKAAIKADKDKPAVPWEELRKECGLAD